VDVISTCPQAVAVRKKMAQMKRSPKRFEEYVSSVLSVPFQKKLATFDLFSNRT
jgi:hypothetical protein